jgi:hypothetical protein
MVLSRERIGRGATREAACNAMVLPSSDDYIDDRHTSPWQTGAMIG